jgi:ferrous iron transport protein A
MTLTLAELLPAYCASIVEVHAHFALAERMAAMGLQPGRRVEVLRRGAFGGPLHVRVGTTELMIRRRDASVVRLEDVHRAPCAHRASSFLSAALGRP